MHRRILILISVGVLALGLAACSSSSKSSTPPASAPASTAAAAITIDSSFTFHTTPVKAGSTVTIKNDSTTNHTVTSDDANLFNTPIDGSGTATFQAPTKPGTYKFHCNIHSFMHGELTVN